MSAVPATAPRLRLVRRELPEMRRLREAVAGLESRWLAERGDRKYSTLLQCRAALREIGEAIALVGLHMRPSNRRAHAHIDRLLSALDKATRGPGPELRDAEGGAL